MDVMNKMMWMVNDTIDELMSLDMEPKPEYGAFAEVGKAFRRAKGHF